MKRPVSAQIRRTGFTLVELLIATALSLMLMGAVVYMVGTVGEGVTNSRAMLESADRLRLAQSRLQMDLAGITATVSPSLKPENNEGYFEYVEGPALTGSTFAVNTDNGGAADRTVGDFDDILMFTTRSSGKPFIGRVLIRRSPIPPETAMGSDGIGQYIDAYTVVESDVAEVAWFLRGNTLHRRVFLVNPQFDADLRTPQKESALALNFYQNNDISVHVQGTNAVPNTLGDLTRREYRFAHPAPSYDVRSWYWTITGYPQQFPSLPTINECSSTGWTVGRAAQPLLASPLGNLDLWTAASGYRVADTALSGGNGARISDDIILTNVIGFDVKAWDPEQGAYMDLGHTGGTINGLGHYGQTLTGTINTARIYDTWSTTNYNPIWNNGLDDGGVAGIVDDDAEKTNPPPYPIPLRGIQVKIRVFEPDSKQVREVTVEQDFLPR